MFAFIKGDYSSADATMHSVFSSSGRAGLIEENKPDDIIMMSYESTERHLKLWCGISCLVKGSEHHEKFWICRS